MKGMRQMKLINIGFGNMVSAGRIITIVSPESAPIKRIIQDARDNGVLIDGQRSCHSVRNPAGNGCKPFCPE